MEAMVPPRSKPPPETPTPALRSAARVKHVGARTVGADDDGVTAGLSNGRRHADFSELFTQSARIVLPLARQKGLISYFDYQGPCLALDRSGADLRSGIHRLFLGLTDCLQSGLLVFSAEANGPEQGSSDVVVHAMANGTFANADVVNDVLRRLELHPIHAGEHAASNRSAHSTGRCPATQGEVTYLDAGVDGIGFMLKLPVPAQETAGADPFPDAAGAMAWLVCNQLGGLDSVAKRLKYMGWRVATFESLPQALGDLHTSDEDPAPPMLLIAAESSVNHLPTLESLAADHPSIWIVLAVMAGSSVLQMRDQTPIDVRVLPLSPLELERFTKHVDWRTSTSDSRETSPSPLYSQDGRLVLIVDDNVVNQLLARAQLEMLGYEVDVVANGADALRYCATKPPDLVLMDIDMPVMDGIETTRRLRAAQQVGALPPFPIVASTASDRRSLQGECLRVGMAGYLTKPISLDTLGAEMFRLVPTRPIGRS